MESAPRSCAAETGMFRERSSRPGQVCRNATQGPRSSLTR
jgi:hypothetical protein